MRSCLDYVLPLPFVLLILFSGSIKAGGSSGSSGYGLAPISHSGHGGISSTIIIVEDAKGNLIGTQQTINSIYLNIHWKEIFTFLENDI